MRLLPPLICGIIFQWYMPAPVLFITILSGLCLSAFFLFYFLPLGIRYRFQWIQGSILCAIIFCAAIFLTRQSDIRNDPNRLSRYYTGGSFVIAKINEPPTEKERSFKTEALVESILINGSLKKVTGRLLLYFAKDDAGVLPAYGNRILISSGLQRIRNAGNPGEFNYERYLSFRQIEYRAFLKTTGYRMLKGHSENPLYSLIFEAREQTIYILRKYIRGNKKVTGIAEALLIGYKEDLDKDTVQAYSETGAVHIIAISGMHLGLIYVVLVWLFSHIPLIKRSAVAQFILILSCLWLFSLITGASASVLRSAVMFTCIITGKSFFKKAGMYNSLAAAAFLLLCYDPFLLWDVGFQLSYSAVVGIVWLQKPLFRLFYIKQKLPSKIWEMSAVTLSAQVLTLPISIYYFHQVPTVFLLTNMICVPLSTLILFGEILLISLSPVPVLASLCGKCIYVGIWLMNGTIRTCRAIPFSLAENIYSTPVTTVLLFAFIIFFCSGVLQKKKNQLKISVGFLILFIVLHACTTVLFSTRKKMIVYNISKHMALDFITGNTCTFYGDTVFNRDAALQNFYLKPARTALQVTERKNSFKELTHSGRIWRFYSKKIMIIDSAVRFEAREQKIKADVLLISHNPNISMADLSLSLSAAVIVFDASNSLWKIGQWKKECEQLHLPCHTVTEQGAFILDANYPR